MTERVGSRNLDNTCSVEGCSKGCWKVVCQFCAAKIRRGELPEQFGFVANPPCKVRGCNDPRYTLKQDYCRAHYGRTLTGAKAHTKRDKRKNGSPLNICVEEGCNEIARTKKRCQFHYSEMRYSYLRKTWPCKAEGCPKSTKNTYCARHRDQIEKYGITWQNEYPKEELQALRDSKRPPCEVYLCEKVSTSEVSRLCAQHRTDKAKKKGLTTDEYLALRAVDKCDACGDPNPTATDHDHSCPHARDEMCSKCIRGRLCNGCNTAIGFALDSPERLRMMATYLDRWSGVKD